MQINFIDLKTFLSTKYYGVFTAVVIAVNVLYDTWKMVDDRSINGVRNFTTFFINFPFVWALIIYRYHSSVALPANSLPFFSSPV